MIDVTTVYVTRGKQFPRLADAIKYREGLIDEFFRMSPGFGEMRARDRIAFIQSIIDRRGELMDLLDWSTDEPERE